MNRKSFFISLALLISVEGIAQAEFPSGWTGHWKGELLWYKGSAKDPAKVPMEMYILPADSGKYQWQIIYGKATDDNRPYTLIPVDISKGHWMIDENNGIVLDQYMIAGKFCGTFTVQNSTILNTYRLENGQLIVEFYSYTAKPVNKTGKGNDEIPFVDSYQVNSYQKAILLRQ
jgi:hypothetical protein